MSLTDANFKLNITIKTIYLEFENKSALLTLLQL